MLLKQMAIALGLPERVIKALARKASHAYKIYLIPKRAGGYRQIQHPSKELKALQRWLVHNVILHWPVHSAAIAYRRGLGIADNAEKHVGSRYLLRMDLEQFFPSITSGDVMTYLKSSEFPVHREWTLEDLELFTTLVCRNGCLVIGAPTSPALSNALCFRLDHQLQVAANAHDVVYSRYADDLFFSSIQPNVLEKFPDIVASVVAGLECPAALSIKESKTRHSSRRGRRQVTGLVLRSDEAIGIGRRRKRYIRGLIHKFGSLSAPDKRRLAGLLAFARSIEPDFINALIIKYGPERIAEVQQMS